MHRTSTTTTFALLALTGALWAANPAWAQMAGGTRHTIKALPRVDDANASAQRDPLVADLEKKAGAAAARR